MSYNSKNPEPRSKQMNCFPEQSLVHFRGRMKNPESLQIHQDLAFNLNIISWENMTHSEQKSNEKKLIPVHVITHMLGLS